MSDFNLPVPLKASLPHVDAALTASGSHTPNAFHGAGAAATGSRARSNTSRQKPSVGAQSLVDV